MRERVTEANLGTMWEPNGPDAVLVSNDLGRTALALRPHFDDLDQRCLVLVWTGAQFASIGAPNDEAISGHRLYDKGLSEIMWAGVVRESQLVDQLERQNRVHPAHHSSTYSPLTHHVLPLKEAVIEVVARNLAIQRHDGATLDAAVAAVRR
ncbi:hypothetical protein [Pseudonocardia sp.]|uniref:hypothetical protein n=1 Tax=Pseudonocardia sp. TaxID=60912 RepID=UPI0031FD52E6